MPDHPEPAHAASIARFLLEHVLTAMNPLDRALAAVPDDRLGERPVPEQYPVGLMIAHAFQAVGMCARSIRRGVCTEADVAALGDPESAGRDRARIGEIGRRARAEVRSTLKELDPPMATRTIDFYFGYEASATETAALALSELVHHRGQVVSFLRLMGIEPPDVYETASA